MLKYLITATRKDGLDPDHRIDAVLLNGTVLLIDAAIRFVLINPGQVFAGTGLLPAKVLVRQHPRTRRQFLTTNPDGFGHNNLLNLPDC